jgi:tetratricopeptide (TPR) repeat protein
VSGGATTARDYNSIMSSSRPQNVPRYARRAAFCLGLLSSIQPLSAQSQEISNEARRHFAEARQAQDAGVFAKAAQEYVATIRLAPAFAGAYSNLGLVYYVQGNFKDSSLAFSEGLHLDPKLLGANLYLGIDYLKLNNPAKALPYLQHAAQLDPSNRDAQKWLGTAYWDAGQTWTALQQLRQTDKRFPNDPDIMFVLGEAYRKAADQEFQALLHSASGTAFVHQVYGDIYLDQHALAKADGHYQAALQQDPNAPNIHFQLGEVALMSGRLDAAEAEYQKQLHATTSNAGAKARLGEVALLQGQIPASLHLLDEALALSPLQTVSALHLPPSFATASETFDAKLLEDLRAALPEVQKTADSPAHNLALTLIAAKLNQSDILQTAWSQFESAIPRQPAAADLRDRASQDFERQSFEAAEAEIHTWLRSHPQDLQAQYLAARTHRLLSLGMLDRLLTAYPDSYRSHQLLAQTYEQQDEDDKAIAEYKEVEKLSPNLPGIHLALGHLLLKDGDLEQATAQLKEELHLDPDQPEANAEMGMALLAQDQTPAAVQYLTKAISLQPDLWTAHQQLGKAYYQQKNYDAARKELTLALNDDLEGVAHYQLGLVYKALGQPDSATREFASSRKIKSDRLSQVKIKMPAEAKND